MQESYGGQVILNFKSLSLVLDNTTVQNNELSAEVEVIVLGGNDNSSNDK